MCRAAGCPASPGGVQNCWFLEKTVEADDHLLDRGRLPFTHRLPLPFIRGGRGCAADPRPPLSEQDRVDRGRNPRKS